MQSSLRLRVLALALAVGPPVAGCSSPDTSSDVVELVRNGEYGRALKLAERQARESPGSEKAQELLRQARVAYLLQDARRTLFEGEATGALALVEAAAEIDPENPTVAMWTLKVKRQLAEEWLDAANDLYASGELQTALDAYERALAFDPESYQAKLGISRVLLTMNYRQGRSKSYYNHALEALRGFLLPQADNSFSKALLYDEENERAETRRAEVQELLLQERLDMAQEFESQKLYFAARNEYRIALLVDAENQAARDGYDRMDREARVRRNLDDAEMDVRRGMLEDAEEALEQSELLTDEQAEEITTLRNQIEDADLESMYQQALELERDYRYQEAILAYEDLLAETGGYADADERRSALLDFSDRADSLYEQFLTAESDLDRLRYLREIDVFWPEYRDVPDHLSGYVKRANELFQRARSAAGPKEARALLEELQGFWPGYPGLAEWMERLGEQAEQR